jgi:AbiV family abortive infection protein
MKKDETSKNDFILIPVEKLQQGFDLCRKQMEMLIESSQILYDSKKYPLSIALSILSREESAKLQLIDMHVSARHGISKKQWDHLTRGYVHERKLKGPVKFSVDFTKWQGKKLYTQVQKWGKNHGLGELPVNYDDIMKIGEKDYARLLSLNEIKKDCFYFDWRDSSWKIFLDRSGEDLEALSLVELTGMKYLMYGFIRSNLRHNLRIKKKDEALQKELDAFNEKYDNIAEFMKTKQFHFKSKKAWSIYEQYFKK